MKLSYLVPGVVMDTAKAPHTYVAKNSHLGRYIITISIIISNIIIAVVIVVVVVVVVVLIFIMDLFQCLSDPSSCAAPGSTNIFGYPAHFDLQNANLQVLEEKQQWTKMAIEIGF